MARVETELSQVDLGGDPWQALDALVTSSWQVLSELNALRGVVERSLSASELEGSHDHPRARVERLLARGRADGSFRTDQTLDWQVVCSFAILHGEKVPNPADEIATPQGALAGSLNASCWSMSTAQNSQPKLEGLLAASSQVTTSPEVSLPVSTPTSKIGPVGSPSLAVGPVPGSPVPVVPPVPVAEPPVGAVSVALVALVSVGSVPVVIGVVTVVGVASLALAEFAGSPVPQAAPPARRRSEGMMAGRVVVISGHPGRMRDYTREPARWDPAARLAGYRLSLIHI